MIDLQGTRRPVSTYRLQLHARFGFAAAADVVPYLDALGIADCYCSPYFKAHKGSTHGYDICEHGRLNPELGSDADYDAFCAALHARDLGHIVDFVPNHMAADPADNPWWRDVLENGPSSPFASYFDIDWDPVKPELKGKVLLPLLGSQYGTALESGELQLRLQDGALHLWYYDIDLPINPRQTPRVIGADLATLEPAMAGDPALREFQSILTALNNLPPYTERDAARILERQREKEVARERLARLLETSAPIREHVDALVRRANGTPGDRASFDALHDLLEHQAYRLAYWRTAFDEINYRRFFDINELVALRMEEPAVFDAAHALLGRLIAEGKVTGVRIDHPDGLFEPDEYFARLQALAGRPLYVVAEKILAHGEKLRDEWPIAGATGYSFLNCVSGLFIDPRHVATLRRIYSRVTGHQEPFREVAYLGRRVIVRTALAGELNVLAHALNRISERDRQSRDFTLDNCRAVLREYVACCPTYRTYVSTRGASEFDRAAISVALTEARRRNPLMEVSIFDFLRDVLLPAAEAPSAWPEAERLRFSMKTQQFTAPVQAKGVEDTAFYRYNVLISANDVGGNPASSAVPPTAFHEANEYRLAHWPCELIATSTHDTKRGEDARARINVLSEIPTQWSKATSEWTRTNGRNRTRVDGSWAPDRNDEYLFYQALLGAWPAEAPDAPIPMRAPDGLLERLVGYMQKASREAKVHTSWINAHQEYSNAVTRFVEATLTGRTAARFLASFVPFARRVAAMGAVNALAQLTLKIASPGVPDFFQGSELWNLSLVDPDNRGDVDFDLRRRLLSDLGPTLDDLQAGRSADAAIADLLHSWHDGRIKLLITAIGLRFRRAHPELMLSGLYTRLEAEGGSDHVVAFARHDPSGVLVVAVPRLIAGLPTSGSAWPLGAQAWRESALVLPPVLRRQAYAHLTGGGQVTLQGPGLDRLPLADVFGVCPVALLWAPTGERWVPDAA